MKLQVKEFAVLSGVSVRTLHYYDEIGLLHPPFVDEQNGYRYYNEASLARMQEICFYRELDFPLKTILEILSDPNYNRQEAFASQRKLLILKKNRLERLIQALDDAEKGAIDMNAFDNKEYEAACTEYKKEVKERWGKTEAYREHETKTAGYTKDTWNAVHAGLDAIFASFAACMKAGDDPTSENAHSLVKELQSYITEHYYTCTKEILAGLGQMYTADERFRKNIDSHAEGTAAFVSEAIAWHSK